MPTLDEDDRTILIGHFGDLVREWQLHRETINRAVNLLAQELLELRNRAEKDDAKRLIRQGELDAKLARLHYWQWGRVAIEVLVLIAIVAFIVGSRLR